MKSNVKIKLNKTVIYEVEVEANNENEAMEFAYDMLERDSYAEPKLKTRKYITCDNCGKKIYFGETIYQRDGYCGCFCSPECYLESDGAFVSNKLTSEEADNCGCDVYDEVEE